MALRLKGTAPSAGAPDRRYYMIDVQEGYRRVRLSTGTRDKATAIRKEQAVIDALRADVDTPEEALREIVRGKSRSLQLAVAKAKSRGRTLRAAMDDAINDRNFWKLKRSLDTIKTNCKMVCKVLGDERPINEIDQDAVDDLVDQMEANGSSPATINRKMHALFAVLKREQRAGKGTRLAKEKDCVIHALRHTCATRLLEITGDIKLVQEWLGHRDIRTTAMIYAKVLARQKMKGMVALESLRTPETGDVPRQVTIS